MIQLQSSNIHEIWARLKDKDILLCILKHKNIVTLPTNKEWGLFPFEVFAINCSKHMGIFHKLWTYLSMLTLRGWKPSIRFPEIRCPIMGWGPTQMLLEKNRGYFFSYSLWQIHCFLSIWSFWDLFLFLQHFYFFLMLTTMDRQFMIF
jgi:hypothetical protein